jgi:hypothetical protein
MTRRRFRYDPVSKEMVEIGVVNDDTMGMMIVGDLPDYTSPVDGKVVSGRVQRRDDLKRTGCREYDPGEKGEMLRRQAADDAALEASVGQSVEKWFYNATPRQRERIVQAMQAGADASLIRKETNR